MLEQTQATEDAARERSYRLVDAFIDKIAKL